LVIELSYDSPMNASLANTSTLSLCIILIWLDTRKA